MDFENVLRELVLAFTQRRVRYGLIGGFAMGALGIARATMDLDFLIHRDDLSDVDEIMSLQGYRLEFRSENASQYLANLALLGQVDVLHAFRQISTDMLARAADISAFDETVAVRTLLPDDIVGLKIQALANDQRRERQDIADIHLLVERFAADLNWGRIADYFALFERTDLYTEIEREYRKC